MTPDNGDELHHADLTTVARQRALQVRDLLRQAVPAFAEAFDEESYALEEGGVSLGFSDRTTGREVVLVLPTDGDVLYFVARDAAGFRRAGVMIEDSAVEDLGRWASDAGARFPSRGLEIG